jgi:hypothetical protein
VTKTPRTDDAMTWSSDMGRLVVNAEIAQKIETELAEAGAEIERKDRLIELMREALSLILEGAIHDFHYVCQHRDNCLCWSCQKKRVNAALSAAERG